jgi:predicted component of type VI protein secretion system
VTAQGPDSSAQRPRLIAVAGSQPAEFPLDYDEILIGSASGNDLVLQDATVSRHHARLARDGNNYSLTDFETINGTYVNGQRIDGTVAISYGDELGFGTARYAFDDGIPNHSYAAASATNGDVEPAYQPAAREVYAAAAEGTLAAAASEYAEPYVERTDYPGEAPIEAPLMARPPVTNGAPTPLRPQYPQWQPDPPDPDRRNWLRRVLIGTVVAVLFAVAFVLTKYAVRHGPRLQSEQPEEDVAMVPKTQAGARMTVTATPIASPMLPNPTQAAASASPHATPRPRHPKAAIAPLPPESAEETTLWLLPLNRYRGVAHLLFVSSDPAMTTGARNHARYLIKNYRKELKKGLNLGALSHTEDPANQWYTPEGSAAAAYSDTHFALGSDSFRPPSRSWAFDSWMTAPFHRLWILNSRLRRVGYGEYCERGVCGAVLEVRSPAGFAPGPVVLPYPIEFPPNGSIVRLTSAQGEWPNPLASCPGYSFPSGLPITLQLGELAPTEFSGYTLTLNGTAPAAIDACGFNSANYHNPDPVAERQAQATLRNVGAIVLIPRAPLAPGSYTASINAAGQQYTWSFTVSP